MGELYWMALLRDVEFVHYGTGANSDSGPPTTNDAAASLEQEFTEYQGPVNPTGNVAQRLFRGVQPGCGTGPYVSQFLIKDIPFGSFTFVQRQQPPKPKTDFLTDFGEWLVVQDGNQPRPPAATQPGNPIPLRCLPNGDPDRRFIRNLRDLTHLVHFDISYQHYFNACLLLQYLFRQPDQLPGPCQTSVFAPPCLSGPLDLGNPYRPQSSPNQEGFATFGNWHVPTLVAEVATRALWAVWFQKWFVHRWLRPEEPGWAHSGATAGKSGTV